MESALLIGVVSTLLTAATLWVAALMVGVESSLRKAVFASVAIWTCAWLVTSVASMLDPSLIYLVVIGNYVIPLVIIQVVFMTQFGETLLLWFASQAVGYVLGLITTSLQTGPGH